MNDDMLKVLAMLTLAYIVEEEDNVKLIDETGMLFSTSTGSTGS